MKKAIRHHWFYEAPPETVWEFLTQPELLSQWLMENNIKPLKGHLFNFRTKAIPAMDFDGIVHCEVLEVEPLKKLVYSWKGGSGNGEWTLNSVVSWTLVAKDNGTDLYLVHDGFSSEGNQYGFDAMNAGWKKNMEGKLTELVASKQADETTVK